MAGLGRRGARAQAAATPVSLSLAGWAAQAEEDAFNAAIRRYQQVRPEVTIKLEVTGSGGQHYQQVDTRLAGRQAPDLFRVQYQQLGRYAAARAVVDLGKYLDPGYGDAVMPRKAGGQVPTRLEESWSWEEFIRLARAIKAAGTPYGFAMSWQNSVAYRWMPFLYQHGGRLLSDDLSRSVLADAKGIETVAWTQSWFKEGLVPPSSSIKSSEQPQNLFANGTIGMLLGGDWQIPFLSRTMQAEWDVTYMPRDAAMASDLGGNCVAVSRDCKNPEAAADFLKFLTGEQAMQEFVAAAQFLPVRKALAGQEIGYKLRPEAMAVFVRQAATIPEHMVATQTMPNFSRINAKLADELDLAFTSGQDAAATARNIDAQVQPLLAA